MPSSNDLLSEIQELQRQAELRDNEIQQAQTAKAKAAAQIESLTERLQSEFNLPDWSEAQTHLEQLENEAQRTLANARAAFAQAGIE